jgi:hypothetical protein
MKDVFISHASKEKDLADQVCKALEDAGFPCWIAPRDVPPGDPAGWDAALVQGVLQSRMLLLVFSAAASASEHVLREVRLAARERKPILPVRVEDCEPTGGLEYYLDGIQRLDAFPSPRKRELRSHFLRLIGAVRPRLAAGGRSSRPPGREIPALLHYHCDRDDQDRQLEEALKLGGTDAPLVCVIHGDEDQCHDKFLERLTRITLPRVLGLDQNQVGVKEYLIKYPSNFPDARGFRDQLMRNLSRQVPVRGAATENEVAGTLAQFPCPVVIQALLNMDEWLRVGSVSVDPFLDFWAEWPGQGARYRLLVCLLITYWAGPQGWRAWIQRRKLQRANAALRAFLGSRWSSAVPRPGIVLVDELRGVTQHDLEAWSLDPSTREFCGDRDLHAEVRALCRRPGFLDREGRVAMEKVAEALKKLLTQPSAGWETC